MLHWNANGLPLERLQDGTGQFLAEHDILALWDTRCNPAVTTCLAGHFQLYQPSSRDTSPGGGCVIAVRSSLAPHAAFLGFHAHIP